MAHFFQNNLSFPASLIDESDTIWCQKPVGVKNAKMILETPQKVKKNHKTIQNNDFVTLFVGQSVNNALEQAHFKNVAKSMFSGRKRTGFS